MNLWINNPWVSNSKIIRKGGPVFIREFTSFLIWARKFINLQHRNQGLQIGYIKKREKRRDLNITSLPLPLQIWVIYYIFTRESCRRWFQLVLYFLYRLHLMKPLSHQNGCSSPVFVSFRVGLPRIWYCMYIWPYAHLSGPLQITPADLIAIDPNAIYWYTLTSV